MPLGYVPHTEQDQQEMLAAIGLSSLQDLFTSIPPDLTVAGSLILPGGLSEPEAVRAFSDLSATNMDASEAPIFCGAGVYHHFTPSLVPAIMGRSEFLTSYTPYQPERSQGLLQTIYEFQSLVCRLLGMDAANASMYDGATALAEAVIMAHVITGRCRILIPATVHPQAVEVCRTYTQGHSLTVEIVPQLDGRTDVAALRDHMGNDVAAVVVPQPNFLGQLEDVGAISALAREHGALVVATVNPISMALLKPPGEWPADIAVAEGQSLGLPMNFGGPLLGLFACKREYVRQMPGRIVGATKDEDGKRAYTLTLQTREQHIRREKASSNICTNEALYALGATVYLTLMGRIGLRRVSEMCVQRAYEAFDALTALPGWEPVFSGPFFHEFALRCPLPVSELNESLAEEGILGPYDLGTFYPERENTALFCCTELTTTEDISRLASALKRIGEGRKGGLQ